MQSLILTFNVIFVSLHLIFGNNTLETDWFVSRNLTTWKEGYNLCLRKPNFTMASAEEILKNKVLKDGIEHQNGPYWTFGFFGIGDPELMIPVTTKVVIQSLETSKTARTYCYPSEIHSYTTFPQAENACLSKNKLLLSANISNLFSIMKDVPSISNLDSPFWLQNIDVDALSSDAPSKTEIKCILLDQYGTIKTDSCLIQHKVICMKGTLKPTLVYRSNTYTIHPYQTGAETSTTTNNVATSTMPDKQDPAIIASVIALGVLIVFMIVIANCLCTNVCQKAHPGHQSSGQGQLQNP